MPEWHRGEHRVRELQKIEQADAKKEKREPRVITIAEVIMRAACNDLSVEYEIPKRGRRWPKNEESK